METSEVKTNGKARRLLKVAAIVAGSLAGLVLLALVGVSVFLTPERLTRMVSRYGTEYLVNGRVDVRRVDLRIWSTFPHVELTVDSLTVLNLEPQVADTVVSLPRFHGRVNLAALLIGRISVNHVELTRPQATLQFGPDSLTSLSILPPSAPKEEEPDKELSLPDIRLDRFIIDGDARVRYVSVADSVDATLVIRRTDIEGHHEVPRYRIAVNGNLGALPFLRSNLDYGIDGAIGWNPSEPLAVTLSDFKIEVDQLKTLTSLKADFSRETRIDELSFEIKPMSLQRAAELAAELPALASVVPAVETPSTFALKAALTEPYTYRLNPDSTLVLPALKAEATIADGPLKVPAYYVDLSNFGADLAVELSPEGLDRSTAELRRLNASFPGSDFSLTAKATNLASDPRGEGCFRGLVNFSNIDARLWKLLKMRLWGKFDADIDFNLRLSDLDVNRFHRAKLTGEATLRDFWAVLPADSIAAGLTRANLTFGSANTLTRENFRVDSLLTAGVSVDSAWVFLPEMTARLGGLRLGAGVENRAGSLGDTTRVTPMGASVSLRRLAYKSTSDSTRVMLRNLKGGLALTRYQGGRKTPRIGGRLSFDRVVAAMGANRVSLRGGEINASAHKSDNAAKPRRRTLSRADSLRWVARRDSMLIAQSQFERIDLNVDRTMVSLLKKWNVSGGVKASGGRLITPMWPLKTRLKGLDFAFNADSLNLRRLALTTGESDFALRGSINNIQRALGRKNAVTPLRVSLALSSDTINVNELVQTAFRGAAASGDSIAAIELDADDSTIEAGVAEGQAEEMKAIVVPMNIDAELDFSARNIVYSNMLLHDFGGKILIANGAANLRDLRARTDIGSAELNMLYYAPTRSDVDFGMSLDLSRFNLGGVTTLLPALDSIMPMLRSFGGIVNAQVSATTRVDSLMNIDFPSLKAMVRLTGDSLVVLDPATFKTISKWLLFKDKNKNMIDHMDVHLAVEDNVLNLYPFMFDFDRYRLGVMGHNDLNLNLNYHISILKSPIPFKFGINVRGTMDKMKIRLGRAKFKENMAAESVVLGDTVRLNLAREIRNVFQRGARKARLAPLRVTRPAEMPQTDEKADTLSAADSLYFRREGLIEAPDTLIRLPQK